MDSGENAHFLADPSAKKQNGMEVIIYPRGIDIVWGGDSRYWNIPKNDDEKPAELHQVCWLEVTASVKNTATEKYIDPKKRYKVGFEISFEADAFGWGNNYPIYFMTKRGNNTDASWKRITLNTSKENERTEIPEIPMVVDTLESWEKNSSVKSSEDDIISFGLYEVWSGKWKGGLNIHHAFVREV